MPDARVLPLADQDSEHYWAALAEGRLDVQQCRDCSHWTWPPRPICSNCQSDNLAWRTVEGLGEVHSWVTTHNVYSPAFAALVPYTTVLVRLDEQSDILIPGRFLSDVTPHQGMRVHVVAEKLTEELGELNWIAEESPAQLG
jgi:uncharacterized OB-fold protein